MTSQSVPMGRQKPWVRIGPDSTEIVADTLFELVGPDWFDDLAGRFYDGVAEDPVLRPLYPDDLAGPAGRLAGFLCQYWGGPADYSVERDTLGCGCGTPPMSSARSSGTPGWPACRPRSPAGVSPGPPNRRSWSTS